MTSMGLVDASVRLDIFMTAKTINACELIKTFFNPHYLFTGDIIA